jgi:hypothetical protein
MLVPDMWNWRPELSLTDGKNSGNLSGCIKFIVLFVKQMA